MTVYFCNRSLVNVFIHWQFSCQFIATEKIWCDFTEEVCFLLCQISISKHPIVTVKVHQLISHDNMHYFIYIRNLVKLICINRANIESVVEIHVSKLCSTLKSQEKFQNLNSVLFSCSIWFWTQLRSNMVFKVLLFFSPKYLENTP